MKINPVPIFVRMIDLDLTREETAARAKIGKETLRKIEAGQMVRLKSIKKLCLSLGIKTSEVITNAAAFAQAQGPEVLGNSRGQEANEYGNDTQGVGRENIGKLYPAWQRHHG